MKLNYVIKVFTKLLTFTGIMMSQTNFILTLKTLFSKHNFELPKLEKKKKKKNLVEKRLKMEPICKRLATEKI